MAADNPPASRKRRIVRPKVFITAFAVLLLTNIVTAGFLIRGSGDDSAKKAAEKYPFIDIARNYIPQEHFIVNIQPLREKLNQIVEKDGADTISVYFEFLNTGANIQINNTARFYPASLVKLPSALVAMKKVEKGEWHMDSRLVLFEQDKDQRYGSLYQKPVGTSFSIQELVQALLTQSDNTAHRMLMRNLSETELGELKDALGLDDLFDEKSEVSAKEYSRLFRALYNSSFLKRSGSQYILDQLNQTPFNRMLPAGLPQGTAFSHKIGEDNVEKNYLDSGIVYLLDRPYLLTVMIKKHDQAKAQAIMKQISQEAHTYVEGYEK
ncbi:MAG TPA: serine hydrolase [Candidatus Limnocylindria bacterium]|nr:serine hydrolase [Candidatus Limnocylindria bacterium]